MGRVGDDPSAAGPSEADPATGCCPPGRHGTVPVTHQYLIAVISQPVGCMSRRITTRRNVLRLLGTGLGGSALVAGTASASHSDWFPPLDGRTAWGESLVVGDTGIVQPFVRAAANGNPQLVGVYLTGWTLDQLPTDVDHMGRFLSLPDGSVFDHVGFDWNTHGHEPPGIYTVPHFDFHFHMLPESTVTSITPGPATWSIPDSQIPEGYIRAPAIDTDGDGEPDAPAVAPAMGEHLVDPTGPEFQGQRFTHTHIYGAYDPDGDGTAQLHFMEPMITVDFLRRRNEEVRTDIGMPSSFESAGRYPTEYVIRYRPDQDAHVVTMESFESF